MLRGSVATLVASISMMAGLGACLDDSGLSTLKGKGSLSGTGKSTSYNKFDPEDQAPTACGQSDDDLTALRDAGYIYAAVPNAVCGEVYNLTIGGGCYYKEKNCHEKGKFIPLSAYGTQPKSKTIKIIVVDLCTDAKCSFGNHIDIGHFSNDIDPAKTLNNKANIQDTKNNKNPYNKENGTPSEFNFHISSISYANKCVDLKAGGFKDGPGEDNMKFCK